MLDRVFIKPRQIYLIELHTPSQAGLDAFVVPFLAMTNGRKATSYVRLQNRLSKAEGRSETYAVRVVKVI